MGRNLSKKAELTAVSPACSLSVAQKPIAGGLLPSRARFLFGFRSQM